MKCSEVEEKLLLSQSGELEPAETAALEEHLAQCGSCREFARQTLAMLDAIKPAPEMPETLEKWTLEVMKAQARGGRKSSAKSARRFALKLVRDIGVAAAVAAVAIILFLNTSPQPAKPVPEKPTESTAKEEAPAPEAEQPDEDIARDLRKAIREMDSAHTTSLGGSLTDKLDRFKDVVETAVFMQSTSVKTGLEKDIGTVKKKIEKLKEEMTTLALYTDRDEKKTILDNGR